MKQTIIFFLLVIAFFASSIYSSIKPKETKQPTNWYDNLIFQDDGFSFELLRPLGAAHYGGSDIGEVIQTARNIKNGDFDSWYKEWLKTANRVYNLAQQAEKNGNIISARNAYFRASSYYRSASFYMDAKKDRNKSVNTWKMSQKSFLKAIASLPYIKPIKIPYEKTSIDGYLIRTHKKDAPLLILHTGFDGTMEELYFDIGIAAHNRDFNVLLWR